MAKRKGEKMSRGISDYEKFAQAAVSAALAEDLGPGDITTELIVGRGKRTTARIMAKEKCVIAGHAPARLAFMELDAKARYRVLVKDGEVVKKGETVATVTAYTGAVLSAERVALNFLQRMSGIATLTREFVKRVRPFKAAILDTRKTTPCLRVFEREATRAGGANNHRFGLFDAVLIKDNHIATVGGVEEAVSRARKGAPEGVSIETEVRTLSELKEAIRAGAEKILLDNMSVRRLERAVEIAEGRVLLEASGGVTLDNVGSIAATGVDFVSVGAITHSARAVDLSLRMEA